MKKMIKLSLVAAVAVAGLTTSATAGSLENAIKDTTISGKAMIGYNYADDNLVGGTTSNQTEYDLDLTLTTKVNDTISFTTGVEADHDLDNRDDSTDAGKGSEIGLTKAYFTAKTDVATVMVGKQKQPTPFLDDERGDGVVALIPAGPVTIAAGHFTGMNGGANADIDTQITTVTTATVTTAADTLNDTNGALINLNLSQRDISALAVIATAGPVNIQAWYVSASDAGNTAVWTNDDTTTGNVIIPTNAVEHGLDAYSVNLSGKFGPVNVELNHASAELDAAAGSTFDSETLTKLVVSGKVADINLVAGYGMTNDASHNVAGYALNNTRLHGVDLSSDSDAKTNFRLDQLALDGLNDADAILLGASMTFGQTTVGANYLMADVDVNGGTDIDATELDLSVKYAMSKNFSITGLYSDAEMKDTTKLYDETRMELSLNYKF